MCLLVVLSRVVPDAPLVVGANRDERLERPARAMTVLADGPPRVLGGLDEQAGGTWLAVNQHGLVAGLTNRPSPAGRDDSKRSRGELPLWLAGHRHAGEAVEAFIKRFDPTDYNACWLLVGDRHSLYAIEMAGEGDPGLEELPPGVYVLENSKLGEPTAKREHVEAQAASVTALRGDPLLGALREIMRDHEIPDAKDGTPAGMPDPPAPAIPTNGPSGDDGSAGTADPPPRPPQLSANCVHTDGYGTRSSLLCLVPSDATPARVLVADGPPCTAPMVEVTHLWRP